MFHEFKEKLPHPFWPSVYPTMSINPTKQLIRKSFNFLALCWEKRLEYNNLKAIVVVWLGPICTFVYTTEIDITFIFRIAQNWGYLSNKLKYTKWVSFFSNLRSHMRTCWYNCYIFLKITKLFSLIVLSCLLFILSCPFVIKIKHT